MHNLLQRAIFYYQQNRFTQAEEELRRILTERPDEADALAWLGLTLVKLSRYEEAEQAARQAVLNSPNFHFGHYALAWILFERNKFPEAESVLLEALQHEPFSADSLGLLAQTRNQLKNWQGAIEAAEEGLRLEAEHVLCNNGRAMALVSLGRQAEAAETLRSTLHRDPDDSYTHANLGWTILEKGDPKLALNHFTESLRLDATNEWAQLGIVEGLKARFWPYRLLLRFRLYIQRYESKLILIIILLAYFGNLILQQLQANYPALRPWVGPIIVVYLLFVLVSWFVTPLTNLALMLHPLGRKALKPAEKRNAILIALCLVGIGFGYVSQQLNMDVWYGLIGLASFFIMFPIMTWHDAPAGAAKKLMGSYLLVMLGLGTTVLTIWHFDPFADLINVWNFFKYGSLLSWIAMNFFPFMSRVK